MFIQSKYTKIFVSNSLTEEKFNELHNFAVFLNEHKNKISKLVRDDLFKYMEIKPLEFVTEMRKLYKGNIPSSFDKQLYKQVIDAYHNKFEAIQKRLKFEKITLKGFDFYKKNTKKHKKGDFKKVNIERSNSLLSSCLTYLSRYGDENTLEYINEQLKTLSDTKKIAYYRNIIRCCNKFSFERLLNLAISKRERIIKIYAEKPIEFKSLSFSGRCRKKKIIGYNKRFGSVINAFVSLSGLGRKSFDIPVKYNNNWHGNINAYIKPTNDYEYVLTFDEKDKQVKINICKDGERYIPQANDNVIGIDVNCKHNLFSLSDGTTYDYNRKLVNDFCKLSLQIDELKKQNKNYKVGKRKQRKIDVMKVKMVKSEQQIISSMCKKLQSNKVGHIVMENLDNGFGKCYVKDKDNEDINYNRKVKFLGLSSLKNEVEHIARKYNIAVSIVQASYTSKMCPICGCIEDENRPNQEMFECIECGHKDNADFNAATNIRNRVVVTVLRDKLLKQLDNGTYEPKKLKREKVKEVLLSYRTKLIKDRESNFS